MEAVDMRLLTKYHDDGPVTLEVAGDFPFSRWRLFSSQ
jgi:hypothetical protein